MSTKKKDS